MAVKEAEVEVTVYVKVKYDESKFTPAFMEEFREHIDTDFNTIEDHVNLLAWHAVCGDDGDSLVEGYGFLKDMMGIDLEVEDYDADIRKTKIVETANASA